MSHRSDALKYLAPGWFSVVMGLAGLSLAWARAAPILGDAATGAAVLLACAAVLVFVALGLLSLMRWQHFGDAVGADLKHPVRYAFFATVPVSLILLASCGVTLLGASWWLAVVWWVGSLGQLGVTLWVLGRWLSVDKAQLGGWTGLTPVLLIPVVGNVLAPLAGVALGAEAWAAAQFGIGVLLWPVVLAGLLLRLLIQGPWPERLLPTTFVTVAPPAVIGVGALQLGGPTVLAWMCWGVALFFLLWSLHIGRRMLAQPFGVAFWALGFPLAALAALTLRLAMQHPAAQASAMITLALASLITILLCIATWKGLRGGTLLQPEPVALLAVAGSDQPPQPH